MSREYPCIYFEKDGKCRKFSDDNTWSYCVMGPCQEQTLSNADRIRAMSDEELAEFIPNWSYTNACKCEEQSYADCNLKCEECVLDWLQQPAEEDRR